MRHSNTLALTLVAVAACGCIDIDLLDDMIPLDAGTAGATDGDGDADGDGDGDADGDADGDSDAPPATDPDDTAPPVPQALSCAAEERVVESICIAEGPVSASLRLATDEPAVVTVEATDPDVRAEVLSGAWSVEHHLVVVGLPPDGVRVILEDVNGNAAERTIALLAGAGPPVAVTEVYADPLGTEPTQEFVEIANLGDETIDLSGWMIDDEGDANGDLLPEGTVLGAGEVGLLVASAFDPSSADDPQPTPGALLIHLSSSIGTGGLKNTAAESIELYDEGGALVSRYDGAAGKPAPGVSALRIRAEIPDGDPWAWMKSAAGGSTPGCVPTAD